jgi:hypothetical protein
MDLLKKLGDKVQVHATRISLIGVTYQQANQAAKLVKWSQFHVNKVDGGKVDVSFIANKNETQRVWDFLQGDNPEMPDPQLA